MFQRRGQKPSGELGVGETALAEKPRDDRRDAKRRSEGFSRPIVAGQGVPFQTDRWHLVLASGLLRRFFTTMDTTRPWNATARTKDAKVTKDTKAIRLMRPNETSYKVIGV